MDYSQYVMDYLHSAMDYLHYVALWITHSMLRIIYDIDVLLSLSQDWVGRNIIFYFSHTHVISSALHSSLLFLVIPGAYRTVLVSGRFKYILFLPTWIYR